MYSKPIILVNICNPEDITIPPLALLYLGNELKKEGYEVKIFQFKSIEIEDKVKEIIKINPLYIGISVFTGNKTKDSAIFSKKIKEKSNLTIMWGGIHPTLLPEKTLREEYVDFIIHGEAEITIREFTREFEKKEKSNFTKILGLGYKDEDKKIHINEKRPLIEDLDTLSLDWSLINVRNFFGKQWGSKKIIGYTTSRGCPFNCSFCYNQAFNKKRWRSHSEKKVIEDIQKLKDQYEVDGIKFYDDFFFANPNRAINILEKIKLPWYGEARIGMITKKLVEKFIETEAKEILFGLESGSDRILKILNKQQTVKQIYYGVSLLSKAPQLRVVGSFILGCPTETKEETFKTIDTILDLRKVHSTMRYSLGFYLPYPGSELYELAIKKGFQPPQKTEDWDQLDRWSNKLNLSWLDWTHDSNYFMKIRNYTNLLPLKETKIPFLKNLPEKRLKTKDFNHILELKLLITLQKRFAMQDTFTRNIIEKILPLIKDKN